MHISYIGQKIPSLAIPGGKNNPHNSTYKFSDSAHKNSNPAQTVDMRNVSLNEINALIRSGETGLLDIVPYISRDIIDNYGAEYASNVKVDYLGQIESSIAFKKSRGEDTTFMEKVLKNVIRIDGRELPADDLSDPASCMAKSKIELAMAEIHKAAISAEPQLVTGYNLRVMLGIMALGGEAQIEAWESRGLEVSEEMILSASDTFQQAFQSSAKSASGPCSISINRYAIMMEFSEVPDWFIQEYKESLSQLEPATRKAFESGELFKTTPVKTSATHMASAYREISDYFDGKKLPSSH